MSTRSNILLQEKYSSGKVGNKLWFYCHSDGYPEGAMPLIADFAKYVAEGKIRPNSSQAGGWLILLGAKEYKTELPPFGEDNDPVKGSYRSGWKVGAIEPTNAQHSDIEYLYTITVEPVGPWPQMKGKATVLCEEVGGWGKPEDQTYTAVDVSKFLEPVAEPAGG